MGESTHYNYRVLNDNLYNAQYMMLIIAAI